MADTGKTRRGSGIPAAGSRVPSAEQLQQLTPRALLRMLGLSARKGFSQSFLTDEYVVRDIVAAADLTSTDEVLEVGPGLGVLTRQLVRAAGRVVAVELDRRLADLLPSLMPGGGKLEVIQTDFLDFDLRTAFHGPFKVVANLPYHITSPALRKLLTEQPKPELMVVMVQREVADRITAKPGETSLLSIMVQLYSRVSVVRQVPAAAFYPAPKVDSTVLMLELYDQPLSGTEDPESVLRVVAAGFSRRRKQLHNALSEALWFPPGEVFTVLESAGIEPSRRAQTLSIEEWIRLHRAYKEARARWQEENRE